MRDTTCDQVDARAVVTDVMNGEEVTSFCSAVNTCACNQRMECKRGGLYRDGALGKSIKSVWKSSAWWQCSKLNGLRT